MTPTIQQALSIIGLIVVTCWLLALGLAAVLWVREDLRQHRARKRAEQLFVPEEWLPFEDRPIRPGQIIFPRLPGDPPDPDDPWQQFYEERDRYRREQW